MNKLVKMDYSPRCGRTLIDDRSAHVNLSGLAVGNRAGHAAFSSGYIARIMKPGGGVACIDQNVRQCRPTLLASAIATPNAM